MRFASSQSLRNTPVDLDVHEPLWIRTKKSLLWSVVTRM